MFLEETVKPQIHEIIETAAKSTSATGSAKLDAQDRLSQIEEAIQAKRDELSVMQDRLAAIEEQCRDTQEVRAKKNDNEEIAPAHPASIRFLDYQQ